MCEHKVSKREKTVRELQDEIRKKIEVNNMETYHDGSVAALESLKGMLISYNDDYISNKELIDELIPGCIKIINEERIKLRKEIESDYNVDERVYN